MIMVWSFDRTIFNVSLVLHTLNCPLKLSAELLWRSPHFNIAVKCLDLGIMNVSRLLTVNLREDLVYLLGNVLRSKGLRKLVQ